MACSPIIGSSRSVNEPTIIYDRIMDPSRLHERIRDIPDFPKPGIVFKDIMPLLADAEALRCAVDALAEWAEPRRVDYVLGAEARGFILGPAIAYRLGCGFV